MSHKARWKTIGRLVAGNLLVLLVLLALVNGISKLILNAHAHPTNGLVAGQRPFTDQRWRAASYDDSEHARQILLDNHALSAIYQPFVGWSRRPFRGATTTIGDTGDRIHPAPDREEPADGIVRFFGGSTMWGLGADDTGTIPAHFNRLRPRLEAFNHGEVAFNSRQSLDRLITMLAQDEPLGDVVFYDGVNEVLSQCRDGMPVPGHQMVGEIREALDQRVAPPSVSAAMVTLLRTAFAESTLALAGRLVGRDFGAPPPQARRGPDYWDCRTKPEKALAVATNLIRNWEIAHLLTTANGGSFTAILQPNAHFGSPRIDYLSGLNLPLGENYRTVYPIIQKLIAERGHRWVHDISRIFDGDQLIYIDDFHVTSRGNQLIAERISELFEDNR